MTKQIRRYFNKQTVSLAITSLVFVAASSISLNSSAASATSVVGITKVATLIVKSMDDAELYRNSTGDNLSTTTCLQAQGNPIPYRISASSLNNASNFSLGDSTSGRQIPYSILWSDQDGQHRLSDNRDISKVIQVNADVGCELKTLSVKFNNSVYNSVERGAYTDTLSVMIIIE